MPTTDGKPLPGEPGYSAPATPDPSTSTPGLINATPGSNTITPGQAVTGYTPAAATVAPATGSGYSATPFSVTPDATVAGQLKNVIAENSPLMQQAKARAADQMNERGLLNSSMAVGAGQGAVISAALPIAQQDASTYAQAATNTTNATNQASQFGAGATNTANLTNAQMGTSVSQMNAASANTAMGQASQASNTADLAKLQASTQTTLADKQAATSTFIANLQASTSLTQADKQAQLQTTLQNIQSNTQLTLQDKQSLTQTTMQQFQLGGDLQKIAADGTIKASLANTEANYKTLMQTSAGAADLYKQSVANFAAIIANKDIADKTGALNSGVKQLNDALGMIGGIAGMNLKTLLDFSAAGAPVAPATTTGATYTPPVAVTPPVYPEFGGF